MLPLQQSIGQTPEKTQQIFFKKKKTAPNYVENYLAMQLKCPIITYLKQIFQENIITLTFSTTYSVERTLL
jgi:hypothetical protein